MKRLTFKTLAFLFRWMSRRDFACRVTGKIVLSLVAYSFKKKEEKHTKSNRFDNESIAELSKQFNIKKG